MAGLYLHIPFCKQACHYCNFHFSTSLRSLDAMCDALIREMHLQQDYLGGAALSSIYFGGGTPSLIPPRQLERLLETAFSLFSVEQDAEITLEANPDDLDLTTLTALRNTPVNRLSIGIQSFSETDLRLMNRAHSVRQARSALEMALQTGFHNLTADLIYGIPGSCDQQWSQNIEILTSYGIPHISAYCLTVENQTALHHFVQKGTVPPVDEAQAVREFDFLIATLEDKGYLHYEISNFALPGSFARHNSNYWRQVPYLGIGPSAHSYNGQHRQWNIAHNARYLKAMQAETPGIWFEQELLTPAQRYNEMVLTSLRTIWGLSPQDIPPDFRIYFLDKITPFLQNGQAERVGESYRLSRTGKFFADGIAIALFFPS
jgi:oxygen-independent coproporphyrinogen-3 oxidase